MEGDFLEGFNIAVCSAQWAMAKGQHQWYHFGVGAPPILVYFSGDWDVHWYGILTHSQMVAVSEVQP